MPAAGRLSGKCCTACEQGTVQAGGYCAHGCGQTMVDATFSATGTVYASTIIRVPAPNLPSPYQVGYVDLPEGVRIFGHFATADPVLPKHRVRVVTHERPEAQAGPFVRYRFLPDEPPSERVNEDG